MKDTYKLTRYHLSLTTFAGIVIGAKHWWCRLTWRDVAGKYQEADAEHGPDDDRRRSFDTRTSARRAGLKLAHQIADGYYLVTEGSSAVIDPQLTLYAPGNLKARLNKLYNSFEKLDGWEAPKDQWPEIQKICDSWESLIGGRTRTANVRN